MIRAQYPTVVLLFTALLWWGCAEGTGPDLVDENDDRGPAMVDPHPNANSSSSNAVDAGHDGDDASPPDLATDTGGDHPDVDHPPMRDPMCGDELTGSGIVEGPQGLMIQVPSIEDECELERALDHVCAAHADDMHDLVLTSVETWTNDEVTTDLKLDILEHIEPYLDCFGNVFVGTVSEILLDDPYAAATINDPDARWEWIQAARVVAAKIAVWMDARVNRWHWYVSYEANLNAFTDTPYRNAYIALLQQHITDLTALNDGVVSWSPTFWTRPTMLNATQRADLASAMQNVFDRVPVDWVLIQDHLGVQPSWTCDDALDYYEMVKTAGPDLASVQLNVEYFTLAGNGIQTGDPAELAARIACYRQAGASLGASFEVRYWYETHGH